MEKGDRPVDFHRITVNVCSRSTPNPLRAHPLHDGGGGQTATGGPAGTGTRAGTGVGSGGGTKGGRSVEEEEEDEYDEDEETLRGREVLSLVAQRLGEERFIRLLPEGQQFLNETAR